MGPSDAAKIFLSLSESKAFQTGIMEDIEDFRNFVPNVDKDKMSDMTANIIKSIQLCIHSSNASYGVFQLYPVCRLVIYGKKQG